jgi:hypothetical protein
MDEHGNLCIYDLGMAKHGNIEIIEYAPSIFKDIRKRCGISEDLLC